MKMTSIGANLRVFGHYSQGGRKYMEDAFVVAYQQADDGKDLEYAFFGVYDGHGGKEAAQYAKKHLLNNITRFKNFWADDDDSVLKAIRDGFIATHLAMWKEVDKWPKTLSGLPSTAGTTASIAFIRKGKIYTGHVGDSKIVVGYKTQETNEWLPEPLTTDHKPDSPNEKKRIYDTGGLVINKAGVERVVWKRPKPGQLGSAPRNTDFDKIPFLAIARSLGDLWSYDYFHKEFVVSPEPDVKVMELDPNRDCCIILASDGLWNMLTPCEAVLLVHETEQQNQEIAQKYGISLKYGWSLSNPSKVLVDRALELWNKQQLRADNTSVVTVIIDPFDSETADPSSEPLIFRTSCSHGLTETDEFWYQKKDPHDIPLQINGNNKLSDSIEDIIQEFCNSDDHENSENSSTSKNLLEFKDTNRSLTASPLQSRSNILPNTESHTFKSAQKQTYEMEGVENNIHPFPRWSRSASGRTSLSKLVSWSKTVIGRRRSDPFPRRSCNNLHTSQIDVTQRTDDILHDEEPADEVLDERIYDQEDNSFNVETSSSYILSDTSYNHNNFTCEHSNSYQIFDCGKCNRFTNAKVAVKRRYSSEFPYSAVNHHSYYSDTDECIYPWKKRPSSYRLSITALKALNDFKHKRQMFSVKM